MPAKTLTVASILTLTFCAATQATISLPTITPVPIPAGTLINQGGGATLDNFVSQDLIVHTTNDWTTAALVLNLTAGSIYQDAAGGASGPASPVIIGLAPSAEYDSYVTSPNSFAAVQGAAGDLGDLLFKPDETTGLSLSWDGGGNDMSNIGATNIGRFTLSDDAQGTWSLAVTEAHKPMARFEYGGIFDGQMRAGSRIGDLTFDGFVGIEDLNIILSNWNLTVPAGSLSDPTGDNFVGIEDLGVVLGNWNAGTPPPLTVPYLWPSGLTGDRDGDGFVGITDKVNPWWNMTLPPATGGDTSGDGFVGLDDQNLLLSNWNNGTPPALDNGVPEPTAFALLALGLPVLIRRRNG